jgi:hypothetical protein
METTLKQANKAFSDFLLKFSEKVKKVTAISHNNLRVNSEGKVLFVKGLDGRTSLDYQIEIYHGLGEIKRDLKELSALHLSCMK